jgi:hypothetical protein
VVRIDDVVANLEIADRNLDLEIFSENLLGGLFYAVDFLN